MPTQKKPSASVAFEDPEDDAEIAAMLAEADDAEAVLELMHAAQIDADRRSGCAKKLRRKSAKHMRSTARAMSDAARLRDV